MQNPEKPIRPYLSFPSVGEKITRHAHFAMATTFEIYITGIDAVYAGQAAAKAFNEIDRLEQELSRFIENSDISRIKDLKKNQTAPISIDTFECLTQAMQIKVLTQGAFDIAFRSYKGNPGLRKCKDLLLYLNPDGFKVTALRLPVDLDLGGIGKGYAIDKTVTVIREWGIERALIHGGKSTVFAFGADWPVSLSDPLTKEMIGDKIYLNQRALSGSGLQKGRHIVDPRTGKAVEHVRAAWAFAPTAGISDALSTAFMIMTAEERESFFKANKEFSAVVVLKDGTKKVYNSKN
jgi:thiamine biosynthesis lipoprotein